MRLASTFLILCLVILFIPVSAQEEKEQVVVPNMTVERLQELIARIDSNFEVNEAGTAWQMTVEKRTVVIITDGNADRMRIMTPILPADAATDVVMKRMLQANFDSALDARYAIARDLIWGVFIHSLSELTDREFLSGLGQTVNVAKTFGGAFTSGALVYGGGDSDGINRALIDELLNKGKDPV